jgi:transcriptional regulator GlxA family with amidase domain
MPRRFAVLLVSNFSLLAYSCAVEPLRAANLLAGRALYTWTHVSCDGRPARASSGLTVPADHGVDRPADADDVLVCASGNPAEFDDPGTFAWLRTQAHRGLRIGGVSGGPFVLARAGLLSGYRWTAHWEHGPTIAESFPDLDFTRRLYEIDRDRYTCAGGTAAIDMMVALIAAEHGRALASAINEWFLHTRPRPPEDTQRMSLRERYDVADAKLLSVLGRMEASLERPLGREALAAHAGVSVRQLERLFRRHLGRTLTEHYVELRLQRARVLLSQSTLSVTETGFACGFASAQHFARRYRARFGQSPGRSRRA